MTDDDVTAIADLIESYADELPKHLGKAHRLFSVSMLVSSQLQERMALANEIETTQKVGYVERSEDDL